MTQPDIISPNEHEFWREQAVRAPQLLRAELEPAMEKLGSALMPYKIGGIGLGAALGAATFSKHVKGKWKYATGAAAVICAGFGSFIHMAQKMADPAADAVFDNVNAVTTDPAKLEKLANYLSATVTAERIQELGLDKAVTYATMNFADQTRSFDTSGARAQMAR